VFRDSDVGLQRNVLRSGGVKDIFEYQIGFAKTPLDVAAAKSEMAANVAASGEILNELTEKGNLCRTRIVDQRSVGLKRFLFIQNGRKLLIVGFNQREGLFGNVFVQSGDRGYRIADKAHLVECDNGLIAKYPAVSAAVRFSRAEIFPGEHRCNTREAQSFRGVDVSQASMSERAPEDFADEHSRKLEVEHIVDAAGNPFHRIEHG
jgi:hypothetical protein